MLAAHAESSTNGLGYWLGLLARPREQLRGLFTARGLMHRAG